MVYHEKRDGLSHGAKDVHRALVILKEEIVPAVMTLEWLRRTMGGRDDGLREYPFSDAPIAEKEGRL